MALDNTYKIAFRGGKNGNLGVVAERYFLQAAARNLLPDDRCAMCARAVIPGKNSVKIHKLRASRGAYFGNVMRCERLWVCPVCASRISENRREELGDALKNNPQYRAIMVTFTLSHHAGERLAAVLGRLQGAYNRFMGGRAIQAIKREFDIVGFISTLEITYGENGWHPHIHALVIVEWGADVAMLPPGEVARYLDERIAYLHLAFWLRWRGVVTAVGGVVSPDAFDVRAGDGQVADYVAKYGRLPSELRPEAMKWSAADELTKAIVKRARGSSRSPWQLLSDYAVKGDETAGKLFQEYAASMKGKQQLRYTVGLRALLGLGAEKSLEEIVTEDDALSDVLAVLNLHQWRVVLQNSARGAVLELASTGDGVALVNYLNSLPGMGDFPVGVEDWIAQAAVELGGVLSLADGK